MYISVLEFIFKSKGQKVLLKIGVTLEIKIFQCGSTSSLQQQGYVTKSVRGTTVLGGPGKMTNEKDGPGPPVKSHSGNLS